MIESRFLLFITFIGMFTIYSIVFPTYKIIDIIINEYILIIVTFIVMIVYVRFKRKLKDLKIYELLPNINHVSLQSSIAFFVLFEAIDYYSEDGFRGMISLWFMYWVFGVLIYFITHIINLYKNYQAYKHINMI